MKRAGAFLPFRGCGLRLEFLPEQLYFGLGLRQRDTRLQPADDVRIRSQIAKAVAEMQGNKCIGWLSELKRGRQNAGDRVALCIEHDLFANDARVCRE